MRLPLCRFCVPCALALLTVSVPRLPGDDRLAPPSLPALLDQLGSADFAEREAATRALEGVGVPALAGLRQAAAGQDPEVRRRAAELVGRIEKRVEAARLLEAKRVRLVFQETPVPEAVAEFARRTGFTVQLEGSTANLAHRRLTFDTGAVPFWEAFDEFCRRAGVAEPDLLVDGQQRRGANPNANNPYVPGMAYPGGGYTAYNPYNADWNHGRLVVVEGRQPELPTCTAGAVRVRALPAHVTLPAMLLGSDERLVGLEVAAEPDVAWQGVIALRVTRAVDERGRRLPAALPFSGGPTNTEQQQQYGFVRVWNPAGYVETIQPPDPRYIPVRLRVGPSGTRLVKELEGVLTAQVQTPPQTLLRVDDVTAAVGQAVRGPHGGWLKVLEVSRDANGLVKVHGQIAYPPSEEAAPAWMGNAFGGRFGQVVFFMGANPNQVEVPNLELRDNRGLPFTRLEQPQGPAAAVTDSRPRDFRLTFQPRPGQTDPTQLVYVGRRALLLEVPFTLKNVSLR